MEMTPLTRSTRISLGIAASFTLLAIASPASAQSAAPAAQPPATTASEPSQAPAVAPSESQLRKFARAVIDLTEIQQEMEPRIQAAPEQERPALAQQANERMASAVQRHDLDAPTFNQIAAAVRQDPQLAQQVQAYVQEVQQESVGR
jgi:hypothetical protein